MNILNLDGLKYLINSIKEYINNKIPILEPISIQEIDSLFPVQQPRKKFTLDTTQSLFSQVDEIQELIKSMYYYTDHPDDASSVQANIHINSSSQIYILQITVNWADNICVGMINLYLKSIYKSIFTIGTNYPYTLAQNNGQYNCLNNFKDLLLENDYGYTDDYVFTDEIKQLYSTINIEIIA